MKRFIMQLVIFLTMVLEFVTDLPAILLGWLWSKWRGAFLMGKRWESKWSHRLPELADEYDPNHPPKPNRS